MNVTPITDIIVKLETQKIKLKEALEELLFYTPKQKWVADGKGYGGHYVSAGEALLKVIEKCNNVLEEVTKPVQPVEEVKQMISNRFKGLSFGGTLALQMKLADNRSEIESLKKQLVTAENVRMTKQQLIVSQQEIILDLRSKVSDINLRSSVNVLDNHLANNTNKKLQKELDLATQRIKVLEQGTKMDQNIIANQRKEREALEALIEKAKQFNANKTEAIDNFHSRLLNASTKMLSPKDFIQIEELLMFKDSKYLTTAVDNNLEDRWLRLPDILKVSDKILTILRKHIND